MEGLLHDRVALVTGAGSGIGAAIARRFARAGAGVALVGRRSAPLEAVASAIEGDGGVARPFRADVTRDSEAAAAVDAVRDSFGRLDILVNNAGAYAQKSVLECDVSTWDRLFAVNVRAPFVLCRCAHPHLRQSPAAVVLNILSTLAHRPVAGTAAYSASKAALLSLTQCLALEWAAEPIRVVGLAPGVVDTPIHGEGIVEAMGSAHPLGRVGRPEEIAEAALFLAGDGSRWTTGAVLDVDGGIRLA